MKDYYKILGVTKSASKEEIKKAYRKLAHEHHPDKTGGDGQHFKEVNEAYQVLGNDRKRKEYDMYGQVFDEGGGGNGGWDFGNFSQGFSSGDTGVNFEEIFEGVFGGFGGRHYARRGRDISIDVELSFEEAVFGAERRVLLNKLNKCARCGGEGVSEGSKKTRCVACRGSGTIKETRRSFIGVFSNLKECDSCHGRGEVPEKPCKECAGLGVVKSDEEVVIRIPAGVNNGEMIKMSGGGEAIYGGVSGDLYIKLHVRDHATFRREGRNLLMDLEIPFSEAVLGCEKNINILDGVIKVTVPNGVDSGEVLRVRGKGVPSERGRGDLLISIKVKTPKRLSRRAKQLMEELKEEGF